MPILVLCTLICALALTPGEALAYGPGVHVLEADRYAERHPEWADDEIRPFLRFGAIFPDIRSAGFQLPISTHDKDLGDAILVAAQEDGDGSLWKQAFALGYRLHTASDTAAQVVYIPWLTAASDLQLVNLWGSEALSPVGDNELLVEGYGDLHGGGLGSFVDTVWDVVVERPEYLDAIIELVLDGLVIRMGETFDVAGTREGLQLFWTGIQEQLATLDPDVVKELLADLEHADLPTVLSILSSGLLADFYGGLDRFTPNQPADAAEMARLLAHPVGADPSAFFGSYGALFSDLGNDILEDPAYVPWPWYHGPAITRSVVTGFALHSDRWTHRPEVIVYDAAIEDVDGNVLGAIDRVAASAMTLVARSALAMVFEASLPVTMELVATPLRLGLDLGDDRVLASATSMTEPGAVLTTLEIPFDLADLPADTRALHLRWWVEGDEAPWLTTHWDEVAVFADAPLFHDTYGPAFVAALPTLLIVRDPDPESNGWLRGHLVMPDGARGVAGAVLWDGLSTEGHAGGGFGIETLAPGTWTLNGVAHGYGAHGVEVVVAGGEGTTVEIALEVTPRITVPTWSPRRDGLAFQWDGTGLPGAEGGFEVAVGLGDAAPELVPWTGVAGMDETEIQWDEPLEDGAVLRPWVRVKSGPPSRGPRVTIDATAPVVTAVDVAEPPCSPSFTLAVHVDEPHAPVTATEARFGSGDWKGGDPLVLAAPPGSPPWLVEVRVSNAAGLVSESFSLEVCPLATTEPPDPVPDTTGDDSPTASAADGAGGGGGGCGAGAPAATWLALILGLSIPALCRRRRHA
jgi:hypothetical protein